MMRCLTAQGNDVYAATIELALVHNEPMSPLMQDEETLLACKADYRWDVRCKAYPPPFRFTIWNAMLGHKHPKHKI